ncbi:SUKH-4 family immunity protein [Streptomyces sp. NPDC058220]|uniref:SUKH-4 family immunity protein n=1 Tax=Streptomyces sp. NPDC058220 TaxID=3346387 RepID=UPI0036E25FDD
MNSENVSEFKSEYAVIALSFREPVGEASVPASLDVPNGSIGELYQPLEFLEFSSIEPRGRLVKFGTLGLFGSILWDPHAGHVVESARGVEGVRVVNTTLGHFTLCMGGLIERYPFDEDEAGGSWDIAAAGFEDMMRRIDPEAYEVHDNYWYELTWSIKSGDFS